MNEIQTFVDDYNGDQLFYIITHYIGKPLSQTDMNTIVFSMRNWACPWYLIEYLFEYCVSNDHRSMRYIEKVAISWAEQGLDTVEKAKASCTYYNKTYFSILKSSDFETGIRPREKLPILNVKRRIRLQYEINP